MMRIKDYRRLSLFLTLAFVPVIAAGCYLAFIGSGAAPYVLIIGIAGAVLASVGFRLYGRMSMDAVLKFRKPEE